MSNKQSTIRKCKNIRDRVYDREQLPRAVFKREVLKLISPESIIADIGCGHKATVLRQLSSYARKGYGIDLEISETFIDGNIQIMHGNAEALPLQDHSVDVITMGNVVEHLPDPKRVLMECKRVLRPGGSLILITPRKFYPPILFGRAFPQFIRKRVNFIITGTKHEDTFPAYYRANSAGALRRLGASTGLSVESIRYLSQHPQYLMFSTIIYRCAVAIERHIFQIKTFQRLRPIIFCHFKSPTGIA